MTDEKFESFGFLLSQVARAHRNMVGHRVHALGMHRGQPPVLFMLKEHEGLSSSEMAEALAVTPATLTNKIKRMERSGLVIRQRDPHDERVRRIYMTEKGHGIMARLKASLQEIEKVTLKGFSKDEIVDLRDKMMRILDNIGEFEDGSDRFHGHRAEHHRRF